MLVLGGFCDCLFARLGLCCFGFVLFVVCVCVNAVGYLSCGLLFIYLFIVLFVEFRSDLLQIVCLKLVWVLLFACLMLFDCWWWCLLCIYL